MATRVRSYAKVNVGLAIGPVRADGFHALVTLYQTIDIHDLVTVSARRLPPHNAETRIALTSNHARVPCDGRNTAWKMVERALARMAIPADVSIHIEKRLPVRGGLGAGSANAAAALLGLERELGEALSATGRMELAAEVGSDVPLFLVGGAVLGTGRGENVSAVADFKPAACVVAVPAVGVSTPQAFRDWDARSAARRADPVGADLTPEPGTDSLEALSRVYATLDRVGQAPDNEPPDANILDLAQMGPGNDFEEVVFAQHPMLLQIKREMMGADTGAPALYVALSGSGSAVFGLYRSREDAQATQQRLASSKVKSLITETLPRAGYWKRMFAE